MTSPARKSRRTQWFLAAAVVLAAAGGGGWFAYQNGYIGVSNPADYADPDGVFTARFPNPPVATSVTAADPKMLRWGERGVKASVGRRDYAVTVQDGLNPGDLEPGPWGRDRQADMLLVLLASNSHGDVVHRREVKHEGHDGREVVIAGRDDGKVMAVRVVVGDKCAVRMTVHGPGDKANPEAALADAAGFFESVKLGPAVHQAVLAHDAASSAVLVAMLYRANASLSDERYKGKWVRLTGTVTDVVADGSFTIDGGVAVRRAPPARMSVPVRKDARVLVTGKCEGLIEGMVVLTDAVVSRPPS